MTSNELADRIRSLRRYPLRLREVPFVALVWRIIDRSLEVRVMGLAAEMTYYALLSFFPLIGALGASLGFAERFIGAQATAEIQTVIVQSLGAIFETDVTQDVIVPMVEGLLYQERAGFAIGGLLVSLFMASRVFRSAIHTLDLAYHVEERRGTVALWTLGFLFSIGAIITAVTMLALVVIGPLLGLGRVMADWVGLGQEYEFVWSIARWPVVFVIAIAFLAALYRFGPNVRNTWRQSVPGAVFGMVALVLVAIGFQLYLGYTGLESPEIRDADEAVALSAQVIGAVLAALLWLWLSGVAILTGGVVNAELSRMRRDVPPPQA